MNAQQTYSKIQKDTLSGRDLEARVLSKASSQYRRVLALPEGADRNKQLETAVRFNLRVWDIFHADWESPECPLGERTRTDLIRLSAYVHKTSLEVLAYGKADKIRSLVQINDSLVTGLTTHVAKPAEITA